MHKAKIGLRCYLTLQERSGGCWMAEIAGEGVPAQRDDCVSSSDLEDAKHDAYRFAISQCTSKGIKIPGRIAGDQLQWTTVSK